MRRVEPKCTLMIARCKTSKKARAVLADAVTVLGLRPTRSVTCSGPSSSTGALGRLPQLLRSTLVASSMMRCRAVRRSMRSAGPRLHAASALPTRGPLQSIGARGQPNAATTGRRGSRSASSLVAQQPELGLAPATVVERVGRWVEAAMMSPASDRQELSLGSSTY